MGGIEMILLPVLNALFGWLMISALFWFCFHPYKKKNFFIIELQGLVPKRIAEWGSELAMYATENFLNISALKEGLLEPEKISQVTILLEGKVDDFLRNRLKEKIPIFSMFVTDSLIQTMKDVLMKELEQMIPDMIRYFADDLEKKYDLKKNIREKIQQYSGSAIEKAFYKEAGRSILQIKIFYALLGFALGWIEILLLSW